MLIKNLYLDLYLRLMEDHSAIIALSTQSIWRSNNYINAIRLVDAWFSIE